MKSTETPEEWLARVESLRRAVDLYLDRDGRWWHEGKPFTHQRLIEAFNSGIDIHPSSSEPIIRIGDRWCYFTSEDTPFIVLKIAEQKGSLMATLNTGETIPLPSRGLFIREDRLYANLALKRWAVFGRAAQASLEPWLNMSDTGDLVLSTSKQTWPINETDPTA